MNHYTQTLAVDQGTTLGAVGTTIHVVDATGEFELKIGDDIISLSKGTTYKTTQFERIRVTNKHSTTNNIDLLIGVGEYTPPMKLVGDVNSNPVIAATVTTHEDVAVGANGAQVIASNANRKELILENVGANPLRLGDSNVSNTRGIKIDPNSSIILTTTASMYAQSTGGSTLAITEVLA